MEHFFLGTRPDPSIELRAVVNSELGVRINASATQAGTLNLIPAHSLGLLPGITAGDAAYAEAMQDHISHFA